MCELAGLISPNINTTATTLTKRRNLQTNACCNTCVRRDLGAGIPMGTLSPETKTTTYSKFTFVLGRR
jgi:hypothetical protein